MVSSVLKRRALLSLWLLQLRSDKCGFGLSSAGQATIAVAFPTLLSWHLEQLHGKETCSCASFNYTQLSPGSSDLFCIPLVS